MRAFFAIDLPPPCKQQLGAAMEELTLHLKPAFRRNPFRWVRPENLHITLQFLASLKEEDITTLLQLVRDEIQGFKFFYLRLAELEWFPSAYQPHVLSLKSDSHEILTALSQALGRGMHALGYSVEERPFRSHVTMARVEGVRNLAPELLSAFDWPALPQVFVKEIVLFKSETQRGGSLYTRLAGIELDAS